MIGGLYLRLGIAAALLAAFAGMAWALQNARSDLVEAEAAHAIDKAAYAGERAAAADALAERTERYREREQKLANEIVATREDADEKVNAARATAAGLRDRLRLATAARPAAGGLLPPPGGLAAFAAPALGGDRPIVLGTLGEADISEAERADVIRVELLACYRAYDAARQASP